MNEPSPAPSVSEALSPSEHAFRVDLNQKIHAVVVLELTGVEDAPGVKSGGVLEQEVVVLENGVVVMDPNDPGVDPVLESKLGAHRFAAVAAGATTITATLAAPASSFSSSCAGTRVNPPSAIVAATFTPPQRFASLTAFLPQLPVTT